jgi:two-component system copper resistance phosphate regulon response regulator CusR
LTAKDKVKDKVKGLDLGADDYLIKPFAFEELLARLRALTRRNYQQKRSYITIEGIKVDLNKQQVYKNGELVILTQREYALLEYLAMRMGQIVTRTDIWEHVYEFNSSTTSNVVDVYIGYLRKKLESKGKPSLIHTVRGRGYMLGAEL